MPKPLAERLRDGINKGFPDACWLWNATVGADGYGHIIVDCHKRRVHRVVYEFYVGEIPDGMHVLHHCDNPLCCNPNHLFLGTHADNMADMKAKGRGRNGRSK